VIPVVSVPFVAFQIAARPENVGAIRRRLVAFAAEQGADAEQRGAIAVAVTEAAANVVIHAYPPDEPPGPIHVEADVEDGDLEVVVADEGQGFTTTRSMRLGAGLAVVARSCDAYAIRERLPNGIEVWMRFPLDGHRD
jgi:anti-sigma regulatory factor (Ser/Thr protein kinase)